MSTDEESDKLHSYPWPELLNRPRREMLVDELLFTTGVTTLVAPSGEGKTTLAMSIGLTVATGGMWAGKTIKPRPVVWVAGEGQDDLRPMYEAWMKEHPECQVPEGWFLEEPIDLSNDDQTDKLMKLLKGMPPALIVTDALADMIGELSEDKSKDINQVYRNIWRVVRKNNGCFFVPHHTGWNSDRERGSTAIRAKSDIVAQINEFNPAAGFIELKHNKRRGGAKLKQFIYEAKLVQVAAYPQPIPIVTGVPRTDANVGERPSETEGHARDLVRTMVEHFFDQGATSTELRKQSGKSETTYYRARDYATNTKDWFVGGGGQGGRYKLNPNGSWKAAMMKSTSTKTTPTHPSKEGCGSGGSSFDVGSPYVEAVWKQFGSGSSLDATAPPMEASVAPDPLSRAEELMEKAKEATGVKPLARRKADAQ